MMLSVRYKSLKVPPIKNSTIEKSRMERIGQHRLSRKLGVHKKCRIILCWQWILKVVFLGLYMIPIDIKNLQDRQNFLILPISFTVFTITYLLKLVFLVFSYFWSFKTPSYENLQLALGSLISLTLWIRIYETIHSI